MAEQVQEGGAPVVTPLSELVDKPRLSDQPAAATPEPATPALQETPAPTPQPRNDERPKYVSLDEHLDLREKKRRAEEERDRYRKAWDEHQRKLAEEQDNDPAPDMFRDPDGYNAWLDRQLNRRAEKIARQHVEPIVQQVSTQTLRLSELTAERALGPERWKALNDWIPKQGQQFMDWCMSQPDPYHAAWEQYRTRTTFERLGNDDIESYEKKLREKIMAELKGPVDDPDNDIDEPPARTPPNNAPRSFAASRSAQPRDQEGRWAGPKPLSEIDREKHQRKKR